jgi:PAS domain S-box-containing protein
MKQNQDARKPQVEVQQQTVDGSIVTLSVFIAILFIGLVAISVAECLTSLTSIEAFEQSNVWSYYVGITQPQLLEVLIHSYQAVFLNGGIETFITNVERESARALDLVTRTEASTGALLDGSDLGPSILGQDDRLDEVFLKETCEPDQGNDSDFHDTYRCANLAHLFPMYTGIIRTIISLLDDYDGSVDSALPVNAFHIVTGHLYPKLGDMRTLLVARITDSYDLAHTNRIVLFVLLIVATIVATILLVMLRNSIGEIYTGMLIFLRRCCPAGIVANTHLLNYLLNIDEKREETMSATQTIIHSSSDGIVCIAANCTIESVSTGMTAILSYIPEQLLGQSAMILFAQADGVKVQQRIEMMIRKECPHTFTDNVECMNEADTPVACDLTIMAMDDPAGDVTSFVLILRDVTILLSQQQAAETAKAQSEKLLYEILPRDIVNRLNQHEKDITFVVPSATLLFIDIQKFSQYTVNLTPQEIMGNLSLIFCGFDDLLPKYPLITKIKLIGDVYMCGAGLFNPDDEPEKHAEQTLRFALDALKVLDETNVKLSAALAVRIGINTGGPVIAGVLGTDKPVFDIIGDPINIAARLQSTCVAGKVQISEDTFSLVRGHGFMIEPRGEIFLKGKGNRPAFLVSPSSGFAVDLSAAGSKVFSSTSLLTASAHQLPA